MKVLLVEDEEGVRGIAAQLLQSCGYQVMEAGDGEQALEIIKENSGSIDLLISDVVMPNMDGPAMVAQARRAFPDLPVLFMSGYAEEQLRKEINIADVHFLPKPFTVQQVTDKVGAVLATAGG